MKGIIREHSPGHHAIILEQRNPSTGKRRRKWHSFVGTKSQAQMECARLIAEMVRGICHNADKISVAQFMERWLDYVKLQVSPRTHERYAEIARKNLVPLIGKLMLTKLQPVVISAAYAKALASGRSDGKGGLAPQTVHHMHRVLKQAMSQAVRWQMLPQNPVDAVNPPKVERVTMNTYDMQQTGALIDATRGTRVFIPSLLAVLVGLRRSEIAALRWSSINLDGAQLKVLQSAEQMNGACRLKPAQRGQSRTVALAQTIIHELRAHRLMQAQEFLKIGMHPSDDDFVCAHADGRMMLPTWITHEWIKVIRGTTLPAYRFNDLRHAHATHLLASGVHPRVASERLGHAHVGTTTEIYSHAIPGMLEDAVARVDAALQSAMRGGTVKRERGA